MNREIDWRAIREWTLVALVGLLFVTGLVAGGYRLTHPVAPTAPTMSVGSDGPLSVTEDLSGLGQYIHGKSQQTLITSQLAACADLQAGKSYSDTATDVGSHYGVAGQLSDFLTTQAVNTFCFDQSKNIKN